MTLRASTQLLLCTLLAGNLAACGDGGQGGGNGGSDGAGLTGGGLGGASFNQCGVAAPLPPDTGQCTAVSAPALTTFDDYVAGTAATSYTYQANGVLGGFLHISDGSDMNGGTSVIATEMVTGAGGTGYALQVSNTNAINWGGAILFYFPQTGATPTCLNAQSHGGVAFSIKGASPTGRFGVSVGMLDTIPTADSGRCENAVAGDCKNANIELALPADSATWAQVEVPWSAFTPGVGSGLSCVPLTGQNIVHLAINPFMRYPPPNYMLEPGPYAIAIDNLRFF
jgi:hypothetical protein